MLDNPGGVLFNERWRILDLLNTNRINGAGLSQILIYQRRQYLSNWKNVITANGPLMIDRLFKVYCFIHHFNGTAIEREAAKRNTIRFLFNPRSLVQPYQPFFDYLRRVAYPNDDHKVFIRGSFQTLSRNWDTFIHPLIRMQTHVSEFSKIGREQVSTVSLVPLHGCERLNITLDTAALYALFNKGRARAHQIPVASRGNKPLVWSRCFDLSHVQRHEQNRFVCRTDGISFNFLYECDPLYDPDFDISDIDLNNLFRDESDVETSDSESESALPDDDEDGEEDMDLGTKLLKIASLKMSEAFFENLVAIDTGARYPIAFTKREPFLNFRETIGFLSSYKYHALAGYNEHKQASERHSNEYLKRVKSLQAACKAKFGSVPSAKDGRYILLTVHRLKILPFAIPSKIQSPTLALLKFKYFKIKQALLQKIVFEITRGKPTLVVIGPNPIHKNSPIPCYVRCPLNEIGHALMVDKNVCMAIVNEWGSTKTCSFSQDRGMLFTKGKRHVVCQECVEQPYILPTNEFRIIDMFTSDYEKVPFVQPPNRIDGSPRTMDRDGNAARNILTIGLCKILGIPLPAALTPN